MTPQLIIRSAAEADISDAALWYEGRSLGLGAEFLRSVDAALAEIRRTPERFPQVHHDVRRALVRRFPYALFYVASAEAIQVVACLHVKRDPQWWQDRVNEAPANEEAPAADQSDKPEVVDWGPPVGKEVW